MNNSFIESVTKFAIDLCKTGDRSSAIGFYYSIWEALLGANYRSISTSDILVDEFNATTIRNRIEQYCLDQNLNYQQLGDFALGRNKKGESLLGYFPEGILELTYILENIVQSNEKEYFQFLVLGKALVRYEAKKLSVQEYNFLLFRVSPQLMKDNRDLLKWLNMYFLGPLAEELNRYIDFYNPDANIRGLLQFPSDYSQFSDD